MNNFDKYYTGGGLHSSEVECIYNFLEKYNIKTILEIGCGKSSTNFFLDYVENISGGSLTSYENDKHWADIMSSILKSRNHEVHTYIAGELKIKNDYDLIFVDGPAGSPNREDSFISAINKSKYVIAHDANNEFITKFVNKHYLTGDLYKKIDIPTPTPSSGIIFVEKNEK
tara:strand:- start:3334 stop:3846 length:513 start_codon:yes stop_codon:yes gene_type:complete